MRVEPVLAFVDAVGQATDGGPHFRLRLVVQIGNGSTHGGRTVAREDLLQALIGGVGGSHLGQDVALAFLGATNVTKDNVEFFAIRTRLAEDAQRRNAQSFLPGITGVWHITAGFGTADVGPVGETDGKSLNFAFGEDRPKGLDVGQVVAARLGQVHEPDVAGLKFLRRHPFEKFLHRRSHDAQMGRNVTALGNQISCAVGQGRGQITRLAQQGRARRAHDDQGHLLGNGGEGVADDFDGEGVGSLN